MRNTQDNTASVAAYVRVSTLDQEKGVQSQEYAVQQYLDDHGLSNVRWFRDRMSGKDTKRPGFEKLQQAIFAGQVKTVVCWKLDRLSRSLRDGINLLCDWLEKDVRVVAVSQQLDFSGPTGRMLASVFFALAEMERENLRENTKRGIAAARARGKSVGRKAVIQVDVVQRLLGDGMTVAAIADRIGVSTCAIYGALKRKGLTISEIRANVEQAKQSQCTNRT